jgi:hypothetical protein
MARSGLRMMPTFPSPSLKFRTVSFPQYGFKVGLSDGAFLNRAQYPVAQFASVLRALPSHRRIPRTVPRDAARLSTSVRAAFAALPPGSSLRPGFCSPGRHRLIDPIRPTRRLAAISLPGRLYATSLLCRVIWPRCHSFLTYHPLRPRGVQCRNGPVLRPQHGPLP